VNPILPGFNPDPGVVLADGTVSFTDLRHRGTDDIPQENS
jgi:hypothetical protein